jgi:hypothetical protein
LEKMNAIDQILERVPIPQMVPIKQTFPRDRIENPVDELRAGLRAHGLKRLSGRRIAIAMGSRGISNQAALVETLYRELTAAGAEAFLVPAMGSHGGATADGQKQVLMNAGIDPEIPIRSSMEVDQIGTSQGGLEVYMDRNACQADGIIVINRVKPHVGFRGTFESGVMKMLAIGLGKQRGAEICHNLGFGVMAQNIPDIGRTVIASGKILLAVALLENAYHETCRIQVLDPGQIEEVEPSLQAEAKELLPRFYVDQLDVLVVDRIGKDISGTGVDNNVIGRFHTPFASGGPEITRTVALSLTDASHGNANGVGIHDFTTKRLYDQMDPVQTYPNSLTSTVPISVKIPMVLSNDRQAIQAAVKTSNIPDWSQVRMARIRDTLSMENIMVSPNVADELTGHQNVEILGKPADLSFDTEGNLTDI